MLHTQTQSRRTNLSLALDQFGSIDRVEKFIQLEMCYASSNLYVFSNIEHVCAVLCVDSMAIVLYVLYAECVCVCV